MGKNRPNKKQSKYPEELQGEEITLAGVTKPYRIFGEEYIEQAALDQMKTAMSLPVSRAGALMPDAHQGYGLPIGGVLATTPDTVIPYAVGVDIACRMCMTIYDLPPSLIEDDSYRLKRLLTEHTVFGVGATNDRHIDSSVFDREEWGSTEVIRSLRNLAWSQLGTSGAGNHFVEWGILDVIQAIPGFTPGSGPYLALLSHSGSRGFGNEIATFYSGLAMQRKKLPPHARHLAWLSMNSQEGAEYWIAMNLAGEYASANHHEIHRKISRDLGMEPLSMIENHHNFAWKERLPDKSEVIIHRKGATPAGTDDVGIIPGSMTQAGFVVRGRGNAASLNSASHGAGRVMSRNFAFKNLVRRDMDEILHQNRVQLIGGDLDEAPFVYKNLERVMKYQAYLVEVLARFVPRIVRMADPDKRARKKTGINI